MNVFYKLFRFSLEIHLELFLNFCILTFAYYPHERVKKMKKLSEVFIQGNMAK